MRGGLIVAKYVTLALLVVSRAVVRENFVLFIHRQIEQPQNTTILVRNRAPPRDGASPAREWPHHDLETGQVLGLWRFVARGRKFCPLVLVTAASTGHSLKLANTYILGDDC